MYPAKKHLQRTVEKFVRLLPEEQRQKRHYLLLAGAVTPFRNDTDREMSFRQESNFYYLSGCQVPGSFSLISFRGGESPVKVDTHDLFIPRIDPADIMWSIPPPTPEVASKTHDVDRVDHPDNLERTLHDLIQSPADSILHILPNDVTLFPKLPLDPTIVEETSSLTITDEYLLPALHQARLIKTPEELQLIKKANEISSGAHETVMRVLGAAVRGAIARGKGAGETRPLLPGEWLIEKEAEAEAIFVASCRREGSIHQAYLPIVAASTRASTLHYCCNDKEFSWGPVRPHDHHNRNEFAHGSERELNPQVLLIDAGCEWTNYASDITRTMPVGNGGKFTPEAKAVYTLVHEMQRLSFEAIRPGVHWDTIQLICHQTLVKGFQKLGIFKSPNSPGSGSWNSEEAIVASGVSAAFFPHGVGHSLGMDVHDVPSASKPLVNPTINKGQVQGHPDFYTYLRLRLPLEVGMVVTVEPGVYFSPHLLASVRGSEHINHDVLARYESVGGVRIEDVIAITENGYEDFTTVRSDVEWLEGVCSGEL